jgi:hypothetical protein
MTMKLNLGCGDNKRPGYVNGDVCGSPDVVCDLSAFSWPWDDDISKMFIRLFVSP